MCKRIIVNSGVGQNWREVELEVGKEHLVLPVNPRKTRNRDRKCVILDFVPVSESYPQATVAKVRYLDTNRVGVAEISDLVPAFYC
jgi:hypothetical protein